MARFQAGTRLCFPGRNVADIDAIYARDRNPDVGLRSRKITFSFRPGSSGPQLISRSGSSRR
jgi:hypothetical protein